MNGLQRAKLDILLKIMFVGERGEKDIPHFSDSIREKAAHITYNELHRAF
jgi:hypothetical protein